MLAPPDTAALPGLTALELATHVVCGPAGDPHSVARQGGHAPTPLTALEAAVLGPLRRSPCLVSFSGGFDSSIVLAAAVRVARREGLADPVPISWQFPTASRARESDWQERVIAELGVQDWIRLDDDGGLELVGDLALDALARHGPLYPANAFLHRPLLEHARGGSLLTGVGGDEIFGRWRGRALADARARRRPACGRDALRGILAATPPSLRARRIARRDGLGPLPWVRAPLEQQVRCAEALERAAEPLRWDRRVPWQATRRRLALTLRSLDLLAADAGAAVSSPLLDADVLRAVARAGGRDGFGDRRATFEATLAAVLPRALRERRTKATFGGVFLGAISRRFASSWNGLGVDAEIVDLDALAGSWRRPQPPMLTALLLQQAALASRPRPTP
jgi:asparagine synthase (glutamine-hydrolysing)